MAFRDITLFEITMSLPDVIRIELRDPPYTRGAIVTLETPVSGSAGIFSKFPNPTKGDELDWGYTMGLPTSPGSGLYTTVKFRDEPHACYLDRDACKDYTNWGISGGSAPSITAAYYANDIYDHGGWTCADDFIATNGLNEVPYILGEEVVEGVSGRKGRVYAYPLGTAQLTVMAESGLPGYFTMGRTMTGQTSGAVSTSGSLNSTSLFQPSVAFRHYIELKLDTPLESRGGPYTITFPDEVGIDPVVFDFDDRITRANGLKFTFIGHRASDESKLGFFEKKLPYPGESNRGMIDLINDYSIDEFEIINSVGSPIAAPLPIVERGSPSTPDYNALRRLADSSTVLDIVSVTNANPGVMSVGSGQGALVANDDILYIGPVSGMGLFFTNYYLKVKNKSGDTFEFQVSGDGVTFGSNADGTGNGVAAALANTVGPHANKLYGTYLTNNSSNHVFGLDYTDIPEATWLPGHYRARIPGIGVSDPFRVGEDVWYEFGQFAARGHYHQTNGTFCDGRFGYTRGYAIRDGENGMVMKWSDLPAVWASQGGLVTGAAPIISCEFGGFAGGWLTNDSFDGAGGIRDAGDWDAFLGEHTGCADQFISIYDCFPAAFMTLDLGWPNLTEMGVANCEDLDDAPDLLTMALFGLDWLKRTQKPDGGIAPSIDGELTQGRSGNWESSDHAIFAWFATLPDHVNNLYYAVAAAHAARLLGELGYDDQAMSYLASAEAAFDFGEDIYQTLIPPKITLSTVTSTFGQTGGNFVEETITGGTSGSTATVVKMGTTEVWIRNPSAAFTVGETITGGTSGATGTYVSLANNVNYDRTYYYDDITEIRRRTAFTANSTSGSYVLTNVSDTAGITVGDEIVGSNISRTDNASVPRALGEISTIAQTAIVASIDTPGPGGQITLRDLNIVKLANGDVVSTGTGSKPATTASDVSYTACRFNGGWSETHYSNMLYADHCLQYEARRGRIAAAMAINRAICDSDFPVAYTPVHDKDYYRDLFETDPTGGGNGLGPETGAQIDYCLTEDPDINESLRDEKFGGIENGQTNFGSVVFSEEADQPWKRCVFGYSGASTSQYGNGHQGWIINEIQDRLGFSDAADQIRRRVAVMDNAHFLHGCNQFGISHTTGFGARWYCSPLHDDGVILGEEVMKGAPDGVTAWGGWGNNAGNPSFLIIQAGDFFNSFSSFDNFGPNGPSLNHLLEPYMNTWPFEHVIDSRWNINEMEFSPFAITGQITAGLMLHGVGGNTQITTDPPKIRLRVT